MIRPLVVHSLILGSDGCILDGESGREGLCTQALIFFFRLEFNVTSLLAEMVGWNEAIQVHLSN